MNLTNIGILAGALAIGYVIYRKAGGGSSKAGNGAEMALQTTTGKSLNITNKDGFILDEMGRVWV